MDATEYKLTEPIRETYKLPVVTKQYTVEDLIDTVTNLQNQLHSLIPDCSGLRGANTFLFSDMDMNWIPSICEAYRGNPYFKPTKGELPDIGEVISGLHQKILNAKITTYNEQEITPQMLDGWFGSFASRYGIPTRKQAEWAKKRDERIKKHGQVLGRICNFLADQWYGIPGPYDV